MLFTRRALWLVVGLLCCGTAVSQPPAKPLPRVLIIGDSISLGYTDPVRKLLEGKAEVHRPRGNCQHTGYGLANLEAWLGDGRWDVIHFNWGIWDTHLLDDKGALVRDEKLPNLRLRHTPEQYRQNLTKLVDTLQKKTPAKLIWASTTPIMSRQGARFEDIPKLNAVAQEVIQGRNIATNNLYDYVLPNVKDWQSADKVHFNPAGNQALAKQVSHSILQALSAK